ncbi:hypothetical protein U1Q18_005468, partial [Sarracenia purpurea var. burkii]
MFWTVEVVTSGFICIRNGVSWSCSMLPSSCYGLQLKTAVMSPLDPTVFWVAAEICFAESASYLLLELLEYCCHGT